MEIHLHAMDLSPRQMEAEADLTATPHHRLWMFEEARVARRADLRQRRKKVSARLRQMLPGGRSASS